MCVFVCCFVPPCVCTGLSFYSSKSEPVYKWERGFRVVGGAATCRASRSPVRHRSSGRAASCQCGRRTGSWYFLLHCSSRLVAGLVSVPAHGHHDVRGNDDDCSHPVATLEVSGGAAGWDGDHCAGRIVFPQVGKFPSGVKAIQLPVINLCSPCQREDFSAKYP